MTELEMIKKVARWPNWPYLPMKRCAKLPGQMPEMGILVVVSEEPLAYKWANGVNLYRIPGDLHEKAVDIDPEQLLREGWVVD